MAHPAITNAKLFGPQNYLGWPLYTNVENHREVRLRVSAYEPRGGEFDSRWVRQQSSNLRPTIED